MTSAGSPSLPSATASSISGLYTVMRTVEGRIGGGEGVEGIYGTRRETGMVSVFDSLSINTGFGRSSVLVDIGAGLGRPLLHALVQPGVRGAFGVEIDPVKVHKAHAFIRLVVEEAGNKGYLPPTTLGPLVMCTSIETVSSLDPATHAFSFWEGISSEGKAAFGKLFLASAALQAVAVVQRTLRGTSPEAMMLGHGFGRLSFISKHGVQMSGGGGNFTAYIFSKVML